ncbi:MAG TPA: FAD-dependent oxidoreductase [Blastocatellia bacterium]|nr:FAD-dependent oxidoreductase [Blastocatellia bacterium]HMV82300.1 FAD-dependent oxidoreductase [Blastocatellia bacterium]HMX27613.1 FAD-dependent oxidoreductase [Blastocatellia bacterium]HMY71082.1 FAD-dependent oxidoreductase [Blastocatellia bacterium]HMZ17795.1 FAD-dependent oxidoreductase [Blastocatellia bacterium]
MNENTEQLGLEQRITRRDFLNATLVGAGSLLMTAPLSARPADDWYGPGGVGDYAASHGNTPELTKVAHDLRDGKYDSAPKDVVELSETYDVVIVGGGFAGIGAAYHFTRARKPGQTCLILDNHPIFGGVAKANEFLVNGVRLTGPQGSNDFVIPTAIPDNPATTAQWAKATPREVAAYTFAEFNLPRQFRYADWDEKKFKPLRFALDGYGPMLWTEGQANVGYYFHEQAKWVTDMWQGRLHETPLSERVRNDFARWRRTTERPYAKDDFAQWLDSMSYQRYLEKELKLGPEVTSYAHYLSAGSEGLGADVTSAYACFRMGFPGFKGFGLGRGSVVFESFPGGNSGFLRHFVKGVFPTAISGGNTFDAILNGRVNLAALDQPQKPVRLRLNANVLHVEHAKAAEKSEYVNVVYVKDSKTYRVKAKGVVMATGGWINRYVVRDLPSAYQQAYEQFHYAPMLVANVALTNWRFLYKLGVTACRYSGGFGDFCSIRRPMWVGNQHPPLDPDKPTVMTFYISFYQPGLSIQQQGARGRAALLSTPFREYERRLREQMTTLFAASGFNARKDIAGIVLNRWGHPYVCTPPGFYFGRNGQPAPREIVKQRFGRIAFGHAELEGHQNWIGAISNGIRALEQVMEIL